VKIRNALASNSRIRSLIWRRANPVYLPAARVIAATDSCLFRSLKDIYRSDAQASELLVIASYNWGEHRVVKFLHTLPANPRDRNFWLALTKHRDKIPQETYDYVFHIFSADVIGEDPKRFGANPILSSGCSRDSCKRFALLPQQIRLHGVAWYAERSQIVRMILAALDARHDVVRVP
jgi:hypothetical protein